MASKIAIAAFTLVFCGCAVAHAIELASFKDSKFAYPATISQDNGGAHRVIDYREMRDINGRDEIPEKRVKGEYVSLSVRRSESQAIVASDAGPVAHLLAGTPEKASAIVIYIHGQGGNARQGMNDFTFGGNFNRIKNLMVRANGLYISPDFADFAEAGETMIAALIAHYAEKSPRAPVFLACGSMGGELCWRLSRNDGVARLLSGMLLLGSMWDTRFVESPVFKRKMPVFFSHGSRDSVFPVEKQEAFFRSILSADPDYPARFVRFETGTHGTPIRMTDWRETLNWMLAQKQ